MNSNSFLNSITIGILLSLGLSSSGYFISQTMYNAKVAINTAEAKGLSEKRVKSDLVNWQIIFKIDGSSKTEIPLLYKKSEQNQKIIIDLLKENGFKNEEIKIGVIDYRHDEYRDADGKIVDEKHNLIGLINIETNQVDKVSKARSNINKLIAKGINIENRAPTYHFTNLNKIKPDMLKEAAQNARLAANEFAENAGATVGGIRNARQGTFYIRDAGENYGDTQKIEKDVRVVTTITFYLTD